MEQGALVWYLARLAMLLLVAAVSLASGLVMSLRRRFAPRWRVVTACVLAVAGTIAAGLSPLRPSPLWLAGAVVAGAALGVVEGRLSEPGLRGGKPAVRRWPIAAWFASAAYVVLAVTVLFGTPALAALGLIWVVLAISMLAGAEAGEHSVAPR